ncbi:MAG: carbon starvation protein A [Deltaproteobacteria bacterium]|jgi:carbon starvation protein|nr:carbon starvation protein A [Deltaproteobacteria bacterium]
MDGVGHLNALTLVFVSLCVFALGYRYYGLWIASRVLRLDDKRVTPACAFNDDHDYVPTRKMFLFGFHFSSISAAGPLIGPILAAQYGYLPGALWILAGSVLGGAVHDMVVLFASVRHKGRSLANIASQEVSPAVGHICSVAVLFIVSLTLAGLSISVVNAMFRSPWGAFTVLVTVPIALLLGVFLRVRPDSVFMGTFGAVLLLFIAILIGPWVSQNPFLSSIFTLEKLTLSWAIPIYGFWASVLPVWLLLGPRGYLSTFFKLGTILGLALSILIVQPPLLMDSVTDFIHGGGPNLTGPMFPFLFITIACGAVSGFHAVIGSGTTPKMVKNEKDVLFVGYGAMLSEGFVAIMALVSACTLIPADYYAISASPEVFKTMGMEPVDLRALGVAVRENIQGRPGGAVTLAVGMSNIFSSIPFMTGLVSYWYHFAIMFMAVFILSAIDSGTRVGRFFLQELVGRFIPRFNDKRWWPGIIIASAVFTGGWGFLVITGDVNSIWPLFGMSNQLLASCALIICTSMLIRLGRYKYAWCTAVPGLFLAVLTLWAGYRQIFGTYLPRQQIALSVLGLAIVAMMLFILIRTIGHWITLLLEKDFKTDNYGDQVLALIKD